MINLIEKDSSMENTLSPFHATLFTMTLVGCYGHDKIHGICFSYSFFYHRPFNLLFFVLFLVPYKRIYFGFTDILKYRALLSLSLVHNDNGGRTVNQS